MTSFIAVGRNRRHEARTACRSGSVSGAIGKRAYVAPPVRQDRLTAGRPIETALPDFRELDAVICGGDRHGSIDQSKSGGRASFLTEA
jgi:hypothetical protein